MIYDLDIIEEYAGKLTPPRDIAILEGYDYIDFVTELKDPNSDLHKAYYRGKARTALRIRENELQLAEAGSPLAVQLVSSYLNDMEDL